MNILFFARIFYPHIGGVETHVLEVGKRLVTEGHNVVVLTEGEDQTDIVEGIRIVHMPVGKEGFFKKFRIWWWLLKHRNLIKVADIVHCHDVFFWYLPFRFLYPNKPVYTTFHGYETSFPPSQKAILIRKISERLSLGNICVGDYIEKWYGTKPSYVTYGAVGMNTNTPNEYQYSQSKTRKLKIIFVGRLEEDIGIHLYLKTLDELKNKNVDYEIIFIGDGSYREEARKYGVIRRVHYDDTYYYSALQRSYFVFASSYLSMFDAMVTNKQVFAAYNNPLKKDYLLMSPFAKYLFVSDSPREIAEKLIYFSAHHDELEKLTNNAYSWAKSQSWDNVVEIYEKLWRVY